MKRALIAVLVLGVLAAAGLWWWRGGLSSSAPTYRTAEVKRGDVVSAINSTGTLEPEEVVDVGAQVAGMIVSFGTDLAGKEIDYGSQVDEGTVLANIDDTLFKADFAQAQAQVDSAQAGITRAEADLAQANARLGQAQRDWDRAKRLGPGDLVAQSQYDAFQAAFEVAKANVGVSEASVVQAKAGVPLAQASLIRAQRNLSFCVIKSPVKGVVIDRRVNIGQTVVSSLNAPSLFLLGRDLKKLEVWAAVNEADVSNVHAGQPANFTVDAFPGRTFRGEVQKVRLNAAMTQNVVTYTVEISADNTSGVLLPYQTANVNFIVDKKEAVLTVPNAALRWTPDATRIEPGSEGAADAATGAPNRGAQGPSGATGASGAEGSAAPTAPTGPTGPTGSSGPRRPRGPGGAPRRPTSGTVWTTAGNYVRPVKVTLGVSDGTVTEISGPDVSEGLVVVIGEERADAAASAQRTANPFAPQMGGRGGPGGGGRGGR